MSYHVINIDSPEAYITCSHGQLCCKDRNGATKSLPLEDVGAIVITSFSSTLHGELLIRAAEFGVSIIFCKDYKPVSLMLPANRSTDTLLTKAFVELDSKKKEAFWQKTIDAKCGNQLFVANLICREKEKIESLRFANERTCIEKESTCARLYWQIFGRAIFDDEFTRSERSGGVNDLLNFAYVILTSIVLQKLFAYGLDPSYGIGHKIRERSTPLAYDIMEPFRPFIDLGVYKWINENEMFKDLKVDGDYKRFIMNFLSNKVPYQGKMIEFKLCIEYVIRSFKDALKKRDIRHYKPWTGLNSKWGGCL